MIKFTLLSILLNIFCMNTYAETIRAEQRLLASWGVEQKDNGIIEYNKQQANAIAYWINKPIQATTLIDFSLIPVRLKPLIIYNN